jgi:predicted phosphodiesterase
MNTRTAQKFDKLLLKNPAVQKEIARLGKLVESQHEQIERYRKAKFTLPAGGKRCRDGKSFIRVIIPDTHGAHIDKAAAAAFLDNLESLNPSEVVMLGDHLDAAGFLAQHHALGFVPETEYTFEQDVAAANAFLDEVQKRTPDANWWYIIGNHEARIEKFIIKKVLNNPRDADYFRRMYGPEAVLGLEKRGMTTIRRDQTYSGLGRRGIVKIGKCLFTHGKRCGVTAARATLNQTAANVTFGHTHRIDSCFKETSGAIVGAWSHGCLCQLHPLYYDTDTTDWSHGYGFHIVQPNGEFMSVTVPIVNGKSLLARWA